jgi:hypothetical protein
MDQLRASSSGEEHGTHSYLEGILPQQLMGQAADGRRLPGALLHPIAAATPSMIPAPMSIVESTQQG